MIKKKQGSLTKRILQYKTQRSLSKHKQQEIKIQPNLPSVCQPLKPKNQIIDEYDFFKQNYIMSSEKIYGEIKTIQNNDEQFCFDVDLGVPYVQSHHLDSGFQYDEKYYQTTNFPKISSAKQIFTSVLEFSKVQSQSQLDQQNFTDRQNQELCQFNQNSQKISQFKRKSRKQTSLLIEKVQIDQNKLNNKVHQKESSLKFTSDNYFDDQFDKNKIMQKLKITAQCRQQKLRFWNSKLLQLNKLQHITENYSKVSQLNQQNSFSRINSNISLTPTLGNKELNKSNTKRSKFERQPRKKKINLNLKTGIKNKQNSSPIKKKIQKIQAINIKADLSRIQPIMKKLKANKENEQLCSMNQTSNKNININRQEILKKNKLASRSKDKSLIRKVL